ncbi:MAG: TonB-dependent receptor [Pseudomonadota bacterium]
MKFPTTPMVVAVSAAIASMTQPVTTLAQEIPTLEEIVVTGTRAPGRTAEDLPVPVDVLTAQALQDTGETEVGRMLQRLAPSFNFSSSSISDGTDALRPATLRGLGPDQTLVLVNGKRRHQSALIHINTSVGRGTAGTDMNAIPAASIKRIEVLRDGSAAQYGSDAIAGVINIVLDDADAGGRVDASYGEYTEGDGEVTNVNVVKGFALGDGGFLNATLNYRDRGRTNRAGLQGVCAYGDCVELPDGSSATSDPREISFNRRSFRIGDADSTQYAAVLNGAFPVGPGEIYGFATYSLRDNESGAFYRNPDSGSSSYLSDGQNVIPDGFLPLINSEMEDYSADLGYRMEFNNGVSMDVSYTDGGNTIDYETKNSVNYSFVNFLRFGEGLSDQEIRDTIPRNADAYKLELGLQTFDVEFFQQIGDFSLAYGGELRRDEYKIKPGELYSYGDFDTENGQPIYPQDAPGAIQGFNGIAPISAVDENRDVWSVYVDTEYEFSDTLLISAAIRYDDYDDFGDTFNYKLAGNLGVTDTVRLRASFSTGFRAPSMQQLFFNNISTQFVTNPEDPDGPQISAQVGTFRNDSEVAKAIGIPQLKEETSDNYSAGIVWTPLDQMSITFDYYFIKIDDRIVISNQLEGSDDPTGALEAALQQIGANSAQFFLNGANTETKGFDLIATYSDIPIGSGSLDLVLAGNTTETEVTDIFTTGGLAPIDPSVVFGSQAVSIIEDWQPEDRISLTGYFYFDALEFNISLNQFGKYKVEDGGVQTYGDVLLTDIHAKYSFNNGFSVNAGGNNIFDEYPDRNEIGNSRGGTLINADTGETIVSSPGVFRYSRRSAPFGFNGAYWYAGVSYEF